MNQQPIRIFINRFSSLPYNLLFGAGISYAIQEGNIYQTPIVLFFPGAYAGYHMYKNRDQLKQFAKGLL